MSKINISSIESGLAENDAVTSVFKIGDKMLFITATYSPALAETIKQAVINDGEIDAIEPEVESDGK